MIDAKLVLVSAFGYVGALFLVAWLGDRFVAIRGALPARPLIFSLSLAVYCTSWTFFGSVGLAASNGFDFLPVYLGPILLFVFGWRLIQRIIRIAKSQNLTSVADFLAARYGKSQGVAAIAALVACAGTIPYIALQLKAVAVSVETLLGSSPLGQIAMSDVGTLDTALVIAMTMALFAILFGTRQLDATEHQHGLMVAIATESVVKLCAFVAVGLFVYLSFFSGITDIARQIETHAVIREVFAKGFNGGTWLTVTLLSMVCIVLLPRQFHVTVVENNSDDEIRRARWLFPAYLVLINIFVVPIAVAGLMVFGKDGIDADVFVLALPMWKGADTITMLAFVGGLSAATAMVIVESVALAIMVCNGLIVPFLLSSRLARRESQEEWAGPLLFIRRMAIIAILLLAYLFYRTLGLIHGLASIGLLSFAAIAQLAPAFFGGMLWRQGTARGAIAGITVGFGVWAYTLLLPWVIAAGWIDASILSDGPLGIGFLKPQALFYIQFDPLTHGVLWSLGANVVTFIAFSLMRSPEPIERMQAQVFVHDDPPRIRPAAVAAFRIWRTSITVGDLRDTVTRYLGPERTDRAFESYAASRGAPLNAHVEADLHLLRYTEHLLASSIGAASSRLVLSLLLRRSNVGSQSALRLLDDASEALQYNRDLLQSAIDQVRHGLGVFDKDMRLICWNRQFRELLHLPSSFGNVGIPLDDILRHCAERGDFGQGQIEMLIADYAGRLADHTASLQHNVADRILEVRTSPMPQGGIVATFLDITERVAAANALAQANESLERRVAERTTELVSANSALELARNKADQANKDKTRFLAAASHDVLQPLNAARLYVSSLVERQLPDNDTALARNIDASLEAVEEILGALIEISRLDSGRLAPEITDVSLAQLFDRLRIEFEPISRKKGLELVVVPTSVWVRSDRRLLHRMLQNLVSNGIKYTDSGRVLIGARRRGGTATISVIDTGPGIPELSRERIFKEFERLETTRSTARGVGLGLSIVERIASVLSHPVRLSSRVGRGSAFSIEVKRVAAPTVVARAADAMRTSPITGLTALCIDNEPAVLDGMRTLLSGWGCHVLEASNQEQAVRLAAASATPIDIILADYHLDEDVGIGVIAAVRERIGTMVPAIVITADHTSEIQRLIREAGHIQLPKPVRAAALRSAITRAVTVRQAAE